MVIDRQDLERAFRMLAFRCVRTLDEALADPIRAQLVHTCAICLARRDQINTRRAQRRQVVRPPEPCPSRTWWARTPAPQSTTDLKRAAAGDRDE